MTGGRPMLPGPATTDVVGRLSALSPGDRVTSSLPCRRWVGSGQPGPTLALTSVLAKRWYEPYIPPRRQASLLRPPGFPASQRSRHTAPAVPTPRQSNSPRTSPTRPGPVQLAPDQSSSPLTNPARPGPVQLAPRQSSLAPARPPPSHRRPAHPACPRSARHRRRRGSPGSGLVAVGRAVPQVAERRLGLAPGLAVAQVLQRFARLAPRVAVPQILNRLPGLAPRLALAQVADGRLGLTPGLALPEVLQGRLGLAAPLGGLSAVQPGGQLGPPRP